MKLNYKSTKQEVWRSVRHSCWISYLNGIYDYDCDNVYNPVWRSVHGSISNLVWNPIFLILNLY